MSAIPVIDIEVRPAPTARVGARRTVVREIAPAAPRRQVRIKVVPSVAERIAVRAIALGCVVAATYVGSSLGGQVMLEKARHDEIRAIARAESAKKMEDAVQSRIDQVLRPDAIEAWALSHGFVPRNGVVAAAPDATKHAPGLLAMREP
jgi:hypothetical protein